MAKQKVNHEGIIARTNASLALVVSIVGILQTVIDTSESRLFFCIASGMLWFILIGYDVWAWSWMLKDRRGQYLMTVVLPDVVALGAATLLAIASLQVFGHSGRLISNEWIFAAVGILICWCVHEMYDNVTLDRYRQLQLVYTDSIYSLAVALLLMLVVLPAWFTLIYLDAKKGTTDAAAKPQAYSSRPLEAADLA